MGLNEARARASLLLLGCWITSAATLAAADWKIETVDRDATGRYSSLRIDKDGNAHVSYILDDLGHLLKYGFWDHALNKWFTMPVASGASFCSLALDSKQRPHISYADYGTASGSHLRHAYWTGSEWKTEIIPIDSDIVAYYTSIVLDAEDKPTISFYEYRGRKDSDFHIRLRVVSWNRSFWEVRTVDPTEGSGKFNSMVADATGRIRLAYANVGALTASARLATWDGKSWGLDQLDTMAANNQQVVGYSMAMALDRDGIPHLSYWNINVPLIKYATIKSGKWTIEVVDSPGGPAYWDRNSITLDADGQPYTAYYDGRYGELKLAHKEGRNWKVEVVDKGFTGFTSSLQIDRGCIWITYADEDSHSLKVARRELAPASTVKGQGKGAALDASPRPTQIVSPNQLRVAK